MSPRLAAGPWASVQFLPAEGLPAARMNPAPVSAKARAGCHERRLQKAIGFVASRSADRRLFHLTTGALRRDGEAQTLRFCSGFLAERGVLIAA
jgi:hypothetical protein